MQTVGCPSVCCCESASGGQTHDARLMIDRTAVTATTKGDECLMNVAKDRKSQNRQTGSSVGDGVGVESSRSNLGADQ